MDRHRFGRLMTRAANWLARRSVYRFVLRDLDPLDDLDRVADAAASLRLSGRLKPIVAPGPDARSIAVVAPHPDDESVGPGGTLAAAADRGAAISMGFLTDDGGRRDEAQAAAGHFGASARFFGWRARDIPVDDAATAAFAEWVDDAAPGALFLPFLADDHDDHRRASELLWRAATSGKLCCRPDIWAYQVYTSMPCNVLVDITDRVARKRAAIALHRSQTTKRDWAHVALGLNAYNARFAGTGAEARFYEGFFVLPFDDYMDLCARYFRAPAAACYRSPSYRSPDA